MSRRKRSGQPAPAFEVTLWPIDRVKAYHRNPRKIAKAVEVVKESLKAFGWQQPIVVDDAGVVGVGHARLEAARQLGHLEIPVKRSGMTDELNRAYRLADNRAAEEASWEYKTLGSELAELAAAGVDLRLTAFNEAEWKRLIAGADTGLKANVDQDAVPDPPKKPKTRTGDLYELGPHRLVCGDNEKDATWDQLFPDQVSVDLLWTDPPYGVDYGAKVKMLTKFRKGGEHRGHDMSWDKVSLHRLTELIAAALHQAAARMRPGAVYYVAGPAGPASTAFIDAIRQVDTWRQTLVLQWVKDGMVIGRSDYHYRHEVIFYGWRPGAAHEWHGGRGQDSVFLFPRPKRSDLHPHQKPVELVRRCLENSSSPGATVLDCFGGSGTTLIAAEACGRVARLIERDPSYCDVIVQRWEDATGRKATRKR